MSITAGMLTEFARSLDMEGRIWQDSGVVVLRFDNLGTLYLEDLDDNLLVYLVRDIDLRDGKLKPLNNALRLCHYREALPYAVHAGLKNETSLVFAVRLSSQEITLPALEEVLELLSRLHDRVWKD